MLNQMGPVTHSTLAPAYAEIVSKVKHELLEIERLADKKEWSRGDIQWAGQALNRIGSRVFQLSQKAIQAFEQQPRNQKTANLFGDVFGHPVPEWQNHALRKQDYKVILRCVQNAFAQNIVFGTLRNASIGSVIAPGHIAPTVKIAGRTFVLDRWFFERKTAPTLKEYFKELRRGLAEKLPWSPLSLARVAPSDQMIPPVFTRRILYHGGPKGAEAMAFFNQGLAHAEMNQPLEAMERLRVSASLLPMGDTYYSMADLILEYPKKRLYSLAREKKISLRQNQKAHWGNPREALRLLAIADRLDPQNAETYNLMGIAFEKLHQPHKAAVFFGKALAIARKQHLPLADQNRFMKNQFEIRENQKQKHVPHKPPVDRKKAPVFSRRVEPKKPGGRTLRRKYR